MSTPEPATLVPLTKDSITASLDARGVRHGSDADGDIAARWDPGPTLLFLVRGEEATFLHVMAHYDQRFSMQEMPGLLIYCNEWNRKALWPKVYVVADGEGDTAQARLISEVNTDVTTGVSAEQLRTLLDCAIGTSLQLSQNLTEWSERAS